MITCYAKSNGFIKNSEHSEHGNKMAWCVSERHDQATLLEYKDLAYRFCFSQITVSRMLKNFYSAMI